MLPGERMHLSVNMENEDDKPCLLALEHACNVNSGYCAQTSGERQDLEGDEIAMVLQVCEIVEPEDAGGEIDRIRTQVRCLGRVKLLSPETPALDDRGQKLGFAVLADTFPYTDEFRRHRDTKSSLKTTRDHLAGVDEVTEALVSCSQVNHELRSFRGREIIKDGSAASMTASTKRRWRLTPKARDRFSTRRTGRAGLSSPGAGPSLDETLEQRAKESLSNLLQEAGLNEAPASSLSSLHALWGIDLEVDAQRQLISWAACAWLGAEGRREALRSRDAGARLQLAAMGLRERRQTLEAELSMERAMLAPCEAEGDRGEA